MDFAPHNNITYISPRKEKLQLQMYQVHTNQNLGKIKGKIEDDRNKSGNEKI